VEDDGDIYVGGAFRGRIEEDGDIYRGGSFLGQARGMPLRAYQLVACYLIFFGGYF